MRFSQHVSFFLHDDDDDDAFAGSVVVSGGDNEDAATEERISQILSEAHAAMQKKQTDEQVCFTCSTFNNHPSSFSRMRMLRLPNHYLQNFLDTLAYPVMEHMERLFPWTF